VQQVRVADGALEERISGEGDVHFALHELEVEPLVPGLADEGGALEGSAAQNDLVVEARPLFHEDAG